MVKYLKYCDFNKKKKSLVAKALEFGYFWNKSM